ncbi:MAG TPA: TlpA disulfide reductase family protein, partial [Chitinophaga sp.]
MKKLTMLFLLLSMAACAAIAQQRVTITPLYPERGQTVTVTYDPSAPGAAIGPAASAVTLVFTYSNFYNLPWRIPMQRVHGKWTTSFKLADYTTFATFTLESGDAIDKPAKDKHYEIAVYKNKVPVEDGYLYKAYSLSAQMGKSPLLADKQAALYRQELALHPGNYEAKVRLLAYEINKATTDKEKERLRAAVHQVIADRFYAAPTSSGNINKVTMGYLIIGENSRLDSIRNVVMERYPESDMGRELRTSVIARDKDTARQIRTFETELEKETPENRASFTGMHERLFHLYAARKESSKALYHARFLALEKESPYTAVTWEETAQTLLDNDVALDTARFYAQRALDSVHRYPVGIIRYFPETGYIYPYADDSTRQAVYRKASLRLASILGLIDMKQGRFAAADQQMKRAVNSDADKTTMDNAAYYYRQRKDTQQLALLEQFRQKVLVEQLLKQRIDRPAPPLNTFVDMQGKPVPAAALKGKIIVIDFWATWCIPCMQEMPYLQ